MFENLRTPDSSWLLSPNAKVQSLPGAAMQGLEEASQMKDLFNKTQLGSIELSNANRAQSLQQATDNLMKNAPQTPEGVQQVASGLAQKGFGLEALDKSKWAQDWARHNKEYREKDRLVAKERLAASARFIKKLSMSERTQAWETLKREMKEDGYDISDMPPQPTDQVLSVAEKATMSSKDLEAVRQDDEQLAELKRWHDMQANALSNKPPSSAGLTAMWGENGLEIVDKNNATSYPVTSPAAGRQLRPKPPETPQHAHKAVIDNIAAVGKIDNALSKIGDYKKGTGLVKGMAGAFDASAAVLNEVDPKGIEGRAAISDIGSAIFHDRTGANVTISEAPRLKPFVPMATDNYKTLKYKLPRLRALIAEETRLYKATFPGAGPKNLADPSYVSPSQPRAGASGSFEAPPEPTPGKIWSRTKPK